MNTVDTTLAITVEIDGETFELGAVPGAETKLVKRARASVLRNLDLDTLIESLERSADLLFLAYNGVSGFGELRAATNQLQDDLAVLCSQAELALQKFQRQTIGILENMSSTFEWLTQGEEDIALDYLASAALTADKMAEEAERLAKAFDQLADRTRKVCGDTEIQQGKTDEERRKLEEQLKVLEANSAKAKVEAESLGELKTKMQELYEEAKQKAETAENRAFALALTNAILSPIAAGVGAFAAAYTGTQTGASLRNAIPPALPKNPPKSEQEENEETARQELNEAKSEESTAKVKFEAEKEKERQAEGVVNDKRGDLDVIENKLAAAKAKRDKARNPSEEEKKTMDQAVDDAESELETANDALEKARADLAKKTEARTAAETVVKEKVGNTRVKQAALQAASQALQAASSQIEAARKDYADLAQQYEATRKDYLNKWLDYKKQEAEKLGDIAKYAVQMSTVKTTQDIKRTVSDSLVQAIKAFNEVSQILRLAAQFWHQMSAACAQLGADSRLQKDIRIYKDKLSPEKRLQQYEKTAFKTKAVEYMANWKALELVFAEYDKATSKTRGKISENIRKSPSPEESIKLTSILGKELITSAKGAQEEVKQEIAEIRDAVQAV